MPDEIMPRDRAELLWNAIINHTIEAVDAIRDRPELIAAAIAAGLPEMLGDPRDRYEMFLKAIAGAQGGDYLYEMVDIDQSSLKWNTPLEESFFGGHELQVIFQADVPDTTRYIFSLGQLNTLQIAPNLNNLHARVKADENNVGKIVIELLVSNSTTITIPDCDPSADHTIRINRNIYVDGTDYGVLPDRLYNGFGDQGLIYFGNIQNNRTAHIKKFAYK